MWEIKIIAPKNPEIYPENYRSDDQTLQDTSEGSFFFSEILCLSFSYMML